MLIITLPGAIHIHIHILIQYHIRGIPGSRGHLRMPRDPSSPGVGRKGMRRRLRDPGIPRIWFYMDMDKGKGKGKDISSQGDYYHEVLLKS